MWSRRERMHWADHISISDGANTSKGQSPNQWEINPLGSQVSTSRKTQEISTHVQGKWPIYQLQPQFLVKVAQSCPTLCDFMDYTVHGILQARTLEWVALPFSRGSFPTQGLNPGLLQYRQILYQLNHKESPSDQRKSTTHRCGLQQHLIHKACVPFPLRWRGWGHTFFPLHTCERKCWKTQLTPPSREFFKRKGKMKTA